MKELFKRAITGIIYILLLLTAVFIRNKDAFDFLLLIFSLVCLYEFVRIIKLKGNYVYVAFLLIWWGFIYFLQKTLWFWILLLPTLTVNLYLLYFMFSDSKAHLGNGTKFALSLFYVGGGGIFLALIPYKEAAFSEYLIFGVFLLAWVNDTFAYLVGKLLGKHKLYEKVSPNKTIEGAVGGFVFTLITAYFFASQTNELSKVQWQILAFIIVIFGGLGDLVESYFKRKSKLKNSGTILPGHGGMLDRFDSLIFAAPFVYLVIHLFGHVS